MADEPLIIDYFSDVLCVWAYGADIRYRELRENFSGQIVFRYRFISLFGDSRTRIDNAWAEQGGFAAFNQHLAEVCAQWPHTRLHRQVWLQDPPASSIPAHLMIKAAQPYLRDARSPADAEQCMHQLVWQVRCRFFEQAANVGRRQVLRAIVEEQGLPWNTLLALLDDGRAHAALQQDREAQLAHQISGSPELVFNEGRQKLYGNIGYRVIEANIRELLRDPLHGEASWC